MRLQLFSALSLAIGLHSAVLAQQAPLPPLRPDQVAYLALYKVLV
jgi:hypothetical protein